MSRWGAQTDVSTALAAGVLGPFIIGWGVNLLLFGVLLNVFMVYSKSTLYRGDPLSSKLAFWAVLLLCTLNAALCMEELFHFGVTQQRTLADMLSGTIPSVMQPLVTALTAFTVQVFLIRRASKLFVRSWLRVAFVFLVGAVALLALAGSILVAISVADFVGHRQPQVPVEVAGSIWLWSEAITDLGISLALYCTLHYRIVHFSHATDSLIKKIIAIGLRTALYTSLPALAGAILSNALLFSNLHLRNVPVALWIPLSPLYGLSMFTTVASRQRLREHPGDVAERNAGTTTADPESALGGRQTFPGNSGDGRSIPNRIELKSFR